jgi:hypothetical protein
MVLGILPDTLSASKSTMPLLSEIWAIAPTSKVKKVAKNRRKYILGNTLLK